MISDYFPETACGSIVIVSEVPTDDVIDDLNRRGDLHIELNVAKGWRNGSLRFLDKLKNLKGLTIIGGVNSDIDVVQDLTGLVKLVLQAGITYPLDLSKLQVLEDLNLDSVKAPINLPSKSLRKIGWYCPKQGDVDSLRKNEGLTHVGFLQSRAEDLSVLGEFDLQYLRLAGFSKLEDFSFIRNLENLRYLDVDTCKGLSSLDVVENCKELEYLAIDNVGTIESLLPVQNCQKLKVCSFVESTNILDGKIRFLNEFSQLETVAFRERRHYDAKRADLPSMQQLGLPIPVESISSVCEIMNRMKNHGE
jgi:hypothetical protein